MKNIRIIFSAFVLSFFLFSCGEKNDKSNNEQTHADTVAAQVCTYSYDEASTTVMWTAYKFTEKAAVTGKFDTVIVTGTQITGDAMQVIAGALFEIKTGSTQTNDAEKNANIISAFFAKMLNTNSITGKVKSVADGKAVISISMNDVENDVEGEVKIENNKLSFKAEINLDKWNGQDAIKSLNEKCKANHTGKDGKLMVWPDVSLYVETTLKEECK
jgi:hypothetical protein